MNSSLPCGVRGPRLLVEVEVTDDDEYMDMGCDPPYGDCEYDDCEVLETPRECVGVRAPLAAAILDSALWRSDARRAADSLMRRLIAVSH